MNRVGAGRDPLAVLRRIVAAGEWVAIDTETTDLGPAAEIVELAIVGADGQEFLTLVRPRGISSAAAARVHGIDSEELSLAPPFEALAGEVRRWLAGRTVLGYNVAFDRRVLWRAFAQAVQPAPRSRWLCLCETLTDWAGTRMRLEEALATVGVSGSGPMHRAVHDARAVASLARALAAKER